MGNHTSNYGSQPTDISIDSQVEKLDITAVLDDMFKEMLKIWWLIIVIISLTSTIFYFQRKLTYVARYEAYATFTVSADAPYSYSGNYYDQTTARNLGATLECLLSSASMKRIVAEDLGLKKLPGKMSVSCLESTNLLTITCSSKDPEAAYQMLQSVLRNYGTVCKSVIGSTKLQEMDQSGVPVVPVNGENCKGVAKKGFMLGIIIVIALLGILAVTKRTIRKQEDFENVLNIDCFGAIPLARFKKRGKNMGDEADLVLIDNYRIPGGFLESIRAIRTRLEKYANKENKKVFLVTSSIPGEGKSTVSCNLALGLARKGKRVVLVDFDLRSPSLDQYLNIEKGQYGTCDVLRGRASYEEALISYKNFPLGILPGGDSMADTMRILNSDGVGKLINTLRNHSDVDYVILDTPPSAMLADASLIAKHADAGIFVVRQDYAQIKDIKEGIANLLEEELPIAGCILNQAEVGITGYGYGYGYGYGRYGIYGKGYGSYGGYGNEKK